MASYLLATVEDDDVVVAHEHLDLTTHQAMRDAIANRIDVDEAVGSDAAGDAPLAYGHGGRRQGPQRMPLFPAETLTGALVRGAVDAPIGLDHPADQMRFERGEADEREPGNRVSLHVADARLGLAFGARAIRPAGRDRDAPVLAELGECRMHPSTATNRWTLVRLPAIRIHFSPKSICI